MTEGTIRDNTVTLTNSAIAGAAESVLSISSGRTFVLTDLTISNAGSSTLGVVLVDGSASETSPKFATIYVPALSTANITFKTGLEFKTEVRAYATTAPGTNIRISVSGVER